MNKYGKWLLFLVLLLSMFSLIMIYSASSIWSVYKYGNSYHYLLNQFIYLIISLIILFIILKLDLKLLYKYSNIILFLGILLLILVLIPGLGIVKNGSRSWFNFGFISMQPSEFVKLGLIIFTSKYLTKNKDELNNIKKGLFPVLIIILLNLFLIMLEPDFGSAVVIALTLIVILFSSGIKMSFFYILSIIGLLAIASLIIIAPYRAARIVSFLNPWSDPLGGGFQIIQSLYALGAGGLFGLGFGNSIQKQFYLPEPQTDFIFAIICEEFGFVGSLVITILFGLIFYLIMKISLNEKDLFKKYLSFGLGIQILLQAVLNLCVVVGLIPVTGVTLPFVSYGGSSLLVSMISIAIILNITKNN